MTGQGDDGTALAVLVAKLEAVTSQLGEVLAQVRELPRTVEQTYLKQEVYRADLRTAAEARRADQATVETLKLGMEAVSAKQDAWKRGVTIGLIFPVLVVIFSGWWIANGGHP